MKKGNCERTPPRDCFPSCPFAVLKDRAGPWDMTLARCNKPDSFDSIYHPVTEQQPSQEPEDDGDKLGPCCDAVCQDAIVSNGVSCESCEENPQSAEWEEEYGSDDAGD